MKYLFIDTETTGLPKEYDAPYTDIDNWPRLVQLAWIVYDYTTIVVRKNREFNKQVQNYEMFL